MKIWFDPNDIELYNNFHSEQLIITPYLPLSYIKTNISFSDISDYINKIKNCIELTSIEDCKYIVYPNKLDKNIKKYIEIAQKNNKQLLSFYNDDNCTPTLVIPNLKVFRTSLLKSKQTKNEYALPAWSKDFQKYGEIIPRIKEFYPTVGFCGFINHPETNIRRKCIDILNKCNKIKTNFNIRQQFWGGKIDDTKLREEYIYNMRGSDFVLCTRGSGNFSYRFYETLSIGKIPIFIDTDCVIPFGDRLDFTELFPIIKEEEIEKLEDIVLDFWCNIKDYDMLQLNLREIYKKYYSPYGFIEQLN